MLSSQSTDKDDKIMAVLEFYLSLHEADEIMHMLNKDIFNVEEVKERLTELREGEEE